MNQFATGGLTPDLVVLIEMAPPLAGRRLGDDREGELDRIEQAGGDLQAVVADAYRAMAMADRTAGSSSTVTARSTRWRPGWPGRSTIG